MIILQRALLINMYFSDVESEDDDGSKLKREVEGIHTGKPIKKLKEPFHVQATINIRQRWKLYA